MLALARPGLHKLCERMHHASVDPALPDVSARQHACAFVVVLNLGNGLGPTPKCDKTFGSSQTFKLSGPVLVQRAQCSTNINLKPAFRLGAA